MPENQKIKQINPLSIGEGQIDPQPRIDSGEITKEMVDRATEDLRSDKFYDRIEPEALPRCCVDGRCMGNGQDKLGPNAAGGTFSLVMADALTNDRYRQEGETAPQHARRLYLELIEAGYRVGGHDDEKATNVKSGCGAQDKLDASNGQPSILEYMTRRSDDIRSFLTAFGVDVDNDLHKHITNKAQQLREEHYATSGGELRQSCSEIAGDASVATLHGSHHEVALVVNTQPATTLNRVKMQSEYGELIQTFNLDLDALRQGAQTISVDSAEAQAKFVAALYYNLATASVLGGPSLRVVVH